MKLSINKNTIILSELSPVIKKYQLVQLEFYGFVRSENRYAKSSSNIEADILKIADYFGKEKIELELDLPVKQIVEGSNNRKTKTRELFKLAQNIKDGKIDNKLFDEFKKFINTLPRRLKNHQIKAAYHFYVLKNGANFSVPGSGKTSVILAMYEKMRTEGRCNVLFVVGPPSCFQPWQNEFKETLGRLPSVVILSGGNKNVRKSEYYGSKDTNSELYLTTFQTLSNDCDDVINFLRQNGVNVFFVIDEAHYMKKTGGTWADTLLKVAEYALYRCILTGTPMPQSYTDLFNQFEFLWLKENPLNEESRLQIKIWEDNKEHEKVKKLLNEKIGPLFYRVRKKDLKLKPAVFHPPYFVKMNTYEHKIHEFIKAKVHELSKEDYLANEEVLSALWKGRMVRLRQSVSYPRLLLNAIDNYDENLLIGDSELVEMIRNYDNLETTGKLDALTKIVLDLHKEQQKVLIWSNFIGTLDLIKSRFSKLNLWAELIYGKTPRENDKNELSDEMTRERIRDIFVDSKSGLDILIANPAACSESISLHKTCFHAIYFDLSYNCAQYLQSLDRIHRVGGSEVNVANYYFLQYKSTIDQDIKKNLEAKARKMYSVIEQDYEIYDLDMFDEDDDDVNAYKRLFKKSRENHEM